MRSSCVLVVLLLSSACHAPAPAPTGPSESLAGADVAPSDGPRSGCAFESLEALCAAFREHYAAASEGWVSEGCGYGERRSSSGSFAEVLVVGVHVGQEVPENREVIERPLLGSRVRGPASAESPSTNLVLAARIGTSWFPLWVFAGGADGTAGSSPSFEWSLDPSGELMTWTTAQGTVDRSDPYGYGQIDRTVVVNDRGVPMIAATATVERWRGETDAACTSECNSESPRPPYPECARRCTTVVRTTRSWTRTSRDVTIGATDTRFEGRPRASDRAFEDEGRPAETRRLDATGDFLAVCGFTPIVHAIAPATLPEDPASVAARARAREVLRDGTWSRVSGSRAAVDRGAPTATLELYEVGPVGCGGGGCSYVVRLRTIEGSMPEQGVHYFASDRGPGVGCHPGALPEPGESTFVEVAPVAGDQVACGFAGYDGTSNRTWAIVRVFVPSGSVERPQ